MKFDLEDMRYFADRHRGKYKTSGPHFSLVNRFPILFDEYEKLLKESRKDCIWVMLDDPDIDLWYTSCGEKFYIETGTPSDNNMKYCCFCGKVIKEG